MLDQLSLHLAGNLKRLREQRRLTQRELAKIAGVPRPTLAHIERGAANPTLGVLVKVAAALGSSIEELIGAPRAAARLYPSGGLRARARGGARVKDMLPEPLPGLRLERLELRRGGRTRADARASIGPCVLICESGDLTVLCGRESFELSAGDVLVSSREVPLGVHNRGDGRAVAYAVIPSAAASS